jgi:hypothetical protein
MASMVTALSIMVATLMAGNGIEVRSATDCPSSDAILAKLRPLLSAVDKDDIAWVDAATPSPTGEPEVSVRLVRSDASVVADRRLLVQGTCDEMADTVATVLAAWETPQVSQPLPMVEVAVPTAAPSQSQVARPRRLGLRLGAGGGAGFVGGAAATGSLELRARWSQLPVYARGAATGQSSREDSLDSGSVVWRRTFLSLGLGWERKPVPTPYWQASIDAAVSLSWLTASGQGFTPDRRQDAFELGASGALRAERIFGSWSLWLEGRACLWPNQQRAVLSNPVSSSTPLPRLDLMATVGVSRVVFR